MSSQDVAIRVRGIHKSFRLPTEQASGIKQAIVNWTKRVRGYKNQKVLRGISFDVKKGDFFGIVGRNGSGKSTLLKLISQIYEPNSGSIEINGSLVSFIELGVGFNGELTGRDNVYLNGALHGFSRKEIDAMYDEIVEFSELREFMDQKLKNYSSGMQVRLAFACAIRAKSDILVLDEVLAVGDEAFQKKCETYFDEIKGDKNQTVVLVTHDMNAVRRYCNRAIMIKDGAVMEQGNPEKIADVYSIENLLTNNTPDVTEKKTGPYLRARIMTKPVLTSKDTIVVEAKYRAADNRGVYIKFAPLANNGTSLMTANSKVLHQIVTNDKREHTVRYELALTDFNYGDFSMVVLLADDETNANIADYGYNRELAFKVVRKDMSVGGVFKNKGDIKLVEKSDE